MKDLTIKESSPSIAAPAHVGRLTNMVKIS